MNRRLLKRTIKVPGRVSGHSGPTKGLYEEAKDHVAQVHFITGMRWVYIRRVTDSYVHYVVLKHGAMTTKMHRNEWEDRVQDVTIRPASSSDLESFQRVTSAWRV